MSDTPKSMKAVVTVSIERYSVPPDCFDGIMKVLAEDVNAIEMTEAAITILRAVINSPNGDALVRFRLAHFAKEMRMRNINNSGAN